MTDAARDNARHACGQDEQERWRHGGLVYQRFAYWMFLLGTVFLGVILYIAVRL